MSKHQPTIPQVKRFRRTARIVLLDRGLSLTAFSEDIGFPRSTVSKAINQGVFPKVRARIAEALGI